MSWFRIDDKSAFHRKVTDAGNEAWGALCRAGAWSSDHLTDGRVPWSVALTIAPKKIWERLFAAGLCERLEGTTDFLIHDFLDWNPSKEQVLELRTLRSQAGRRGGVAKQQAKAKQLLEQKPSKAEAKSCPVPVPIPREEKERSNGASAPPHTHSDPEVTAIRDRIRRHPVFAQLNAARLADEQGGWMLSKGQKLDWVLEAIDAAAAHCPDGANHQTIHSKLVSFMRAARKPRPLQEPETQPRKVIESKDDPERTARAAAARAEAIQRANEMAAARKAGAK